MAQTFQIVAILVVLLIIIGLLVLCKKTLYPRCCSCFKKLVDIIKAKLMFNSILRAFIQAYLLTSISTWDSLLNSDFSDTKGSFEFAQAIVLFLALVVFPIWIAIFLTIKEEELPNPTFRSHYDSTYQNVDIYKRQALYYTSYFLARRFCFAFLIVFCSKSVVLQVFLSDILSTLMLIFFTSVKPMRDTPNNAIQILNELFVLTCIWLMFWFTHFVGAPQTRYDLAWYFMYLIGFNMAVNVALLLYIIGRKIYLAARKEYLKRTVKNAVDKRILP